MSKQCICKGSLLNYKSNCRWKLFLIAFAGKLIEKVCEMPQAATKASRDLEMALLKKISSASLKTTRLIYLTTDTTITNARQQKAVIQLFGWRVFGSIISMNVVSSERWLKMNRLEAFFAKYVFRLYVFTIRCVILKIRSKDSILICVDLQARIRLPKSRKGRKGWIFSF